MVEAKVDTWEVLKDFVESIFEDQDITIEEWDLKRIYLADEESEFTIHMWKSPWHPRDVIKDQIEWSLVKFIEEEENWLEIKDGIYNL